MATHRFAEEQEIIEELDRFLKENHEVLAKYRRLLRRANQLLNGGTDPWGTCCLDGTCWTERESVCTNEGGTFTPFPPAAPVTALVNQHVDHAGLFRGPTIGRRTRTAKQEP